MTTCRPLISCMALKSLGLCGPRVTGTAISQMAILNNLQQVLKLKRISDLPLLKVLPHFDNIKEIWLVGQEVKRRSNRVSHPDEECAYGKNQEEPAIASMSGDSSQDAIFEKPLVGQKYLERKRPRTL